MARGIVGEPGFRGLISRRAAAELKPALNENFRQKYVASGEIIPILLTAFDAELKPIAEAATERSGDVVWGDFLAGVAARTGVARKQIASKFTLDSQSRQVHILIFPIGALRTVG